MKLGAELNEDVTELTGASGCEGGGTGGTDWIGWGSGATGDSLGGFATGSGVGSATGSLGRKGMGLLRGHQKTRLLTV